MNMKKLNFIVATLFLAVGMSSFIYWFSITAKDISFEAMKAEYAAAFPSFLQNIILSTVVLIIFLATAGILFFQSREEKGFKIPATIGMILSFLLAFWLVFSLM